jgi:hypothetical protein
VRAAASHSVLTATSFNKKRTVFNKRVRPLSRLQQAKNSHKRREAKLLTNSALKPKNARAGVVRARPPPNYRCAGKIWCGQILPLCSKKEQKIKIYCEVEIGLKRAFLVIQYSKIIFSICIPFK